MLWNRIAYDWHITVEEAAERISSVQFTQICAYLRKEPRGYEMENWRAGMIAATVANVAPREKGTKALKPSDFYPTFKKPRAALSPRQEQQLKAKRARDKAKSEGRQVTPKPDESWLTQAQLPSTLLRKSRNSTRR